MHSIITVIKTAFQASLTGPGLLGWLIAFIKPIVTAMNILSDADLMTNYFGMVGKFLETGWGTLASIILGCFIIGYAIIRKIQLESILVDQATSPREIMDLPQTDNSSSVVGRAAPQPQHISAAVSANQQLTGIGDTNKLFRITDRSEVTLRFFPETGAKKKDDVLLLIVYGYKLLLGVESVNQHVAHGALSGLLLSARNSPWSEIDKAVFQSTMVNRDYGLEYVNYGYLERTRWSKGGFYSLTPIGEMHAKELMEICILNA